LRLLQGWVLGLHLRDDRNPKVFGFAFGGNRLFRFFQAFDVTLGRILGHCSRVLQILSFRHKTRECGDGHGVAAMFVHLEKGGVFADLISPFFMGLF
jgi:hypothetical protein